MTWLWPDISYIFYLQMTWCIWYILHTDDLALTWYILYIFDTDDLALTMTFELYLDLTWQVGHHTSSCTLLKCLFKEYVKVHLQPNCIMDTKPYITFSQFCFQVLLENACFFAASMRYSCVHQVKIFSGEPNHHQWHSSSMGTFW